MGSSTTVLNVEDYSTKIVALVLALASRITGFGLSLGLENAGLEPARNCSNYVTDASRIS